MFKIIELNLDPLHYNQNHVCFLYTIFVRITFEWSSSSIFHGLGITVDKTLMTSGKSSLVILPGSELLLDKDVSIFAGITFISVLMMFDVKGNVPGTFPYGYFVHRL